MPYKSQAQRGKFHALEAEGKISPAVVAEFDHASKGMSLPKHVDAGGSDDGGALDHMSLAAHHTRVGEHYQRIGGGMGALAGPHLELAKLHNGLGQQTSKRAGLESRVHAIMSRRGRGVPMPSK
jgi:hypothetical protein